MFGFDSFGVGKDRKSIEPIDLQASISGFKGNSSCVFATMMRDTGVLYIAKESKAYTTARKEGCTLITSDPLSQDWDARFDDEMVLQAVALYYQMNASGRLSINPQFSKLNPSNAIEDDGFHLRGHEFRLLPTINNGAVAVLALCWLADKQMANLAVNNDFDDLFAIRTIR
jgi:hypothetical protein